MRNYMFAAVAVSALLAGPAAAQLVGGAVGGTVNAGGSVTGAAPATGDLTGAARAGGQLGGQVGASATRMGADARGEVGTTAAGALDTRTGAATANGAKAGLQAGQTARSGASTDTSTRAGSSFRVGSMVRDRAGEALGQVLRVDPTGANGEATVTLGMDGRTTTVPASSLSADGEVAVSSQTRAEVW